MRSESRHQKMLPVEACVVSMEVSVLGFPSKDFDEDPLSNKDRRNVPSTKHFIKEQYTVRWRGRGLMTTPRLEGVFSFYVSGV